MYCPSVAVAVSELRARSLARTTVEPAAVLVALLTLGVLALRMSQLHQSLWGDEVWTYQDVVGRSLGSVVRTVHTGAENSPPLFFIFAWLSAKVGDPAVSIRLPTLILGTATIPLVYLLGRETVGRAPGVIGAAIMAASPFATYYGVEARPYTTVAFFVALSTLALVRAVRTAERRWWIVYAFAAAAAAYSHYTAVFPLAVQAAWSLWACRGRLREPLLANALIALLYAPWLPHIRGKALPLFALFEPLTPHHVLADVARLISGYPGATLSAIPTYAGLAVLGICALAGLIAAGMSARGRLRHGEGRLIGLRRISGGQARAGGPLLIVALALATPIGVLVYSIVGTDIWNPRVQYASLPAAVLVLGALLWVLPRVARPVAVAAVLATLVFATIRAISPTYARPPFKSVAGYVNRVAAPRDPVILDPITWGIAVYLNPQHRVIAGSPTVFSSVAGARTVYFIFDDRLAAGDKASAPHPSGFALTLRRHYPSRLWGFTLLRYRRLAVARTPSRSRTA